MNRRMIQLTIVGLALLVPLSATASSVCPPDTIDAGCMMLVDRNITVLPGATCAGGCFAWQDGEPCYGACYDLRVGKLEVHAPGGYDCAGWVRVQDDYWVSGPAPGTPVDLIARLSIQGTIVNANGEAILWEEGSAGTRIAFSPSDLSVNTSLSIPVSCTAGEPFRLHATLGAAGTEAIDLMAVLDLLGPSGATVLSCQGFNFPVPVTGGETWGRVKALFR